MMSPSLLVQPSRVTAALVPTKELTGVTEIPQVAASGDSVVIAVSASLKSLLSAFT